MERVDTFLVGLKMVKNDRFLFFKTTLAEYFEISFKSFLFNLLDRVVLNNLIPSMYLIFSMLN